MMKIYLTRTITSVGIAFAMSPAFAGQHVIIKGVLCTPYSVDGKTYSGCPGAPPPAHEDPYAAARSRGDVRTKAEFDADCKKGIDLEACMPPPTPHGCPEGRSWSLDGTGIAHCVDTGPHYCPPDAPNRSIDSKGMYHCD
jgi:hypothetical protein